VHHQQLGQYPGGTRVEVRRQDLAGAGEETGNAVNVQKGG